MSCRKSTSRLSRDSIAGSAKQERPENGRRGRGVKFHKGLQGDYVPAEWAGRNTSGNVVVYGKNLLVACDEYAAVSEKGVIIPDDYSERMTSATETGYCIFALGPEAFRLFDDGTVWTGDKPKVGDRVHFEKYAGQLAKGRDGRTYRIMDYRCIGAGLDLAYLAEIEAEENAAKEAAE